MIFSPVTLFKLLTASQENVLAVYTIMAGNIGTVVESFAGVVALDIVEHDIELALRLTAGPL